MLTTFLMRYFVKVVYFINFHDCNSCLMGNNSIYYSHCIQHHLNNLGRLGRIYSRNICSVLDTVLLVLN